MDKTNRSASTLEEVCGLKVINLRTRLRDICERLMFLDPLGNGKKAEDLLWRKVYYEVVLLAKNFRKSSSGWRESDQYRIANHISMGIGAYHHLLFRLHTEFQLDKVEGCADFLLLNYARGTARGKNACLGYKIVEDAKIVEWATQAYQRCLICMGDLARYKQELGISLTAFESERYYRQALLVSTNSSMPHNQLGTLAGTVNYNLNAAYNYMRCVMGQNGFDGANGNLNRIFERNQQLLVEDGADTDENWIKNTNREVMVKKFIIHFLQYCKICFDYPNVDPSLSLGNICEVVHLEFQKCLESNLYKADEKNAGDKPPLSGEIIFMFFVMNLICIEKLENKGESHASASIALTLTALSHLLHHILATFKQKFVRIESSLKSPSPHLSREVELPKGDLGKVEVSKDILSRTDKRVRRSHVRCRRKLKASFSLDDDSDDAASICEDSEKYGREGTSESEDEVNDNASDIGEEDTDGSSDVSNNKSNRSSPVDGRTANGHIAADERSKDLLNVPVLPNRSVSSDIVTTANPTMISERISFFGECSLDGFDLSEPSIIEFLLQDSLLSVVKVCADWLKGHPPLIDATARGSQRFCSRFVDFLNLMSKLMDLFFKDASECSLQRVMSDTSRNWKQKWPLPEDVSLSGLLLVAKAHEDIDITLGTSTWLTPKDEILLRMASIRLLGFMMTECDGSGVFYDADKKEFGSGFTTSTTTNHNELKAAIKRKAKNFAKNGGEKKMDDRKKHLMHNMAHQWLQAEVKELETALKSPSKIAFPPYLVPDCSVLIDHLPLVRQLMGSKVFIFILPIAVLQSLDDMKKESSKAREVIRWLEEEFKKRNRYLRAQKQQERLILSILKYPKRKHKDAWNMFTVLECCNYFAHQGSVLNELSPNLVTLLTAGSSTTTTSEKGGHSLYALALSIGLKVESVEDLHARWLTSNQKPAKNKFDKQ